MKKWLYKNVFLKFVRPAFQRVGLDLVAYHPPIDKRKVFEIVAPLLKQIKAVSSEKVPMSGDQVVWQFWWQGAENAPPLVKRCMESVKRHSRGRRVIVIDEHNVSQYVDVPSFIDERHRSGVMSHTHFSDYLRARLFMITAAFGLMRQCF